MFSSPAPDIHRERIIPLGLQQGTNNNKCPLLTHRNRERAVCVIDPPPHCRISILRWHVTVNFTLK